MAYVEIRKNGKLVKKAPLDTEKARRGCSIKVGSLGKVRLALGESKTMGNYEVRIVEDVPVDDTVDATQPADPKQPVGKRKFAIISDEKDVKPTSPGEMPQIEGYQITDKLGEGGMGTVWRAVQLGTRREVALKLLGSGAFGSDKARMRFEREVELAARLEHPNIARVYESGLHHNVHYYAMELIDGVHLDEYVEANELSHRQVLELVQKITEAVQHAHQRGVIHRDLKPSNIMVTEDGKPCVLDFGLAKPSSEDDDAVTISMPGEVAGTPAYMSPEQAAGHIDEIDTRTDVYSLGVILYRLLIRQYPHELSGTRYEVLRRIAEEEVKRPRDVSKKIDKELEALLLKALARESSGRYASAGDLAADINNYLTGELLTAKTPTTMYFLRKRLRKYRVPVAVTTAVLAALIGMAAYAHVNVTRERDRAVTAEKDVSTQRDVARKEATRADAERLAAVAAKRGEEKQRQIAEKEVYRYGISEANRLSLTGMYPDARKLLDTLKPSLRGWEHGHLICRSTRRDFVELITLKGHSEGVHSVAFSPDDKRLASGSGDQTIRLWDTVNGKELLTLKGHSGEVYSVAFSTDGERLVSGSKDQAIKIWDTATGKELITLKSHSKAVSSVAFSPDGKRLASGSWDETIMIWDVVTAKELLTLEGHSSAVSSVAFSPDGGRLASGSHDTAIRLWDSVTGKELFILTGHSGDVRSVVFSPDGKRLASGSMDNTIKLWDTDTGKELFTLRGHSNGVDSIAFSPESNRLASGSRDKTIKLWDTVTGKELLTLRGHSGHVYSVAFSRDGERLASGSGDRGIKLWDTAMGEEFLTLKGHLNWVGSISFSPDGKRLASGSRDKTVKFWDAARGKELRTLRVLSNTTYSVAFSPDGKRLASGSYDRSIKLWDTVTGEELLKLEGHSGVVSSIAFSPDSKRLASGSYDRSIKLWDIATGKELLALRGHSHWVNSIAFSSDGKRLASGSRDKTIKLWDLTVGRELFTINGLSSAATSIAFSPGGRCLASGSGDNTIKLWDMATGKELRTLKGHSSSVFSVAYSPDGDRLASGSGDNTIRLWDSDTGKELLTLKGHSTAVSSVVFSPDGGRLASGSDDNTVKIWESLEWSKSSEQLESEKTERHRKRALPSVPTTRTSVGAILDPKRSRMAADLVDMALGQEYGNPGLPKTSTLNLGKGATLKLTLIPAGKFMMGSKLSAEEVAKRFYSTNMDYLYKAEHPQHQVMISKPFYMGVTEVTRGQFAVFVADSGYKTTAEKEGWSYAYDLMTWGKVTGISWRKTGFKQTDSHPVVCVSWDDAAAFCSWLKAKIGRNVSLPTEAQWEYACRADTKTIYSFGDKAEKRNKHANYCEKSCEFDLSWKDKSHDDGYGFTAPVGSYKPNAWGLYDMHGNVYEWCRDWYDKSFYSRAKNVDPENTTRARYRVIRGGSWFSFAQFCRAASRLRSFSDRRDYSGGFRVVVESGSAVK